MNAQLRELVTEWRKEGNCPPESGTEYEIIECNTLVRCADELEAALAAPKEAGDAPFAFDTLVAHGLANGANVVNGMPWSFKYMGLPVTHENDDHYIVNMPDGSTLNVYRRIAAPSKEAGPNWRELLDSVVSQFSDTGCTCTFQDDSCCAYARAVAALEKSA